MLKTRFLLAPLALMLATIAAAQDIPVIKLPEEVFRTIKKKDDPADTINWRWKRAGLLNVNVAQGSLSNWAAGGDRFSLSINNYFNYFAFYKNGKHSWDTNLDFFFGLMQATSLGTRKNDDRVDFLSKYGYNFDGQWYLTGLFNLRSQFFDGYTYSGNVPSFSSTLLSPAYFIVSAGFDYKPSEKLSVFLSPLTNRTVLVLDDYLSGKAAYGVDSGKHLNYQLGFFSSTNYTTGLGKNVSYKGKLDLFSNYSKNPQNIDVFLTNVFAFKVNKYLSVTYNLDLIYDDDVKLFGKNNNSPALQVKSLLGIGFALNFAPVYRISAAQLESATPAATEE